MSLGIEQANFETQAQTSPAAAILAELLGIWESVDSAVQQAMVAISEFTATCSTNDTPPVRTYANVSIDTNDRPLRGSIIPRSRPHHSTSGPTHTRIIRANRRLGRTAAQPNSRTSDTTTAQERTTNVVVRTATEETRAARMVGRTRIRDRREWGDDERRPRTRRQGRDDNDDRVPTTYDLPPHIAPSPSVDAATTAPPFDTTIARHNVANANDGETKEERRDGTREASGEDMDKREKEERENRDEKEEVQRGDDEEALTLFPPTTTIPRPTTPAPLTTTDRPRNAPLRATPRRRPRSLSTPPTTYVTTTTSLRPPATTTSQPSTTTTLPSTTTTHAYAASADAQQREEGAKGEGAEAARV